jgi:hypothetical protein
VANSDVSTLNRRLVDDAGTWPNGRGVSISSQISTEGAGSTNRRHPAWQMMSPADYKQALTPEPP